MSIRRLLGAFVALACVSIVSMASRAEAGSVNSYEAVNVHHNPQLGRLEVRDLGLIHGTAAWSGWHFVPGPATQVDMTTFIYLAQQFSGDCAADWAAERTRGNSKTLGFEHAPVEANPTFRPHKWNTVDTKPFQREVKLCWYLIDGPSGGLLMSSVLTLA